MKSQNKTSTSFDIAIECYILSENIAMHLLKPAHYFLARNAK